MELEFCGTQKVCGTEVLNDGTQFCGTQKVCGTEVLNDGAQFCGTQQVCGTEVLNDGTQFCGTQQVCGTEVLNDGTQFCGTQKARTSKRVTKCGRRRQPLRASGTGTERSRNCRNQQAWMSRQIFSHWNLELEFREF